jgi:putative intracellular protease/amidase
MNVLFVLTSHNKLGNTDEKTGFWIEEFASPYYFLNDAGVDITLASPKGGQPPVDPKSELPESQTDATHRLIEDSITQEKLSQTKKLSEIDANHYDAIFYPGGHGPLWDLTNDADSIHLIESFYNSGKPVAAVCHAPSVLLNAKTSEGVPIVQGRDVTGFTNNEEIAVGLQNTVPFLLEDELKSKGGHYRSADEWAAFAIKDGLLITGQNPASSKAAAEILLSELEPVTA